MIDLKKRIEKNKKISHLFTLKTDVIAEYFFEAKSRDDLLAIKKYSIENKIPIFILGGGSNLAVTKKIFPGIVVKNNYQDLQIIEENNENVKIKVSSGYSVSLLILKSIENGWSGFEYHYGLPGTVGGAIYMNSKWTRPLVYFGDCLIEANLIDNNGDEKKVDKSYFKFAYDYSILQNTKEILLEAIFLLKKDLKGNIKKRAQEAINYRKKTQPLNLASSGCFFKNPGNISAGYLIDKAGLKNFSVGDFCVSDIHANFIINKGNGKREDLIKLLSIIKNKVKEKFGINLEEEVIII